MAKSQAELYAESAPNEIPTQLSSNAEKRKSQSDIFQHFKVSRKHANKIQSKLLTHIRNEQAEILANRITASCSKPACITYLTNTGDSWIIYVRNYLPSSSTEQTTFDEQWMLHPSTFHELKIFGKMVKENRYSQSWGHSYKYSGSVNQGRSINESKFVQYLIHMANDLVDGNPFNGCLQNWYEPEHHIGLHSDDEKSLQSNVPIFSLTWGGPRRFLFRPRPECVQRSLNSVTELLLNDGDLVVMGGATQRSHKHEVPKVRVTKDDRTSRRINWTIRAFVE